MGELEYKVEHNGGVYGADKQSKGTLTQEGKNKWLNLVFCSNASSFPGLSGMGEKGGLLFYKGLF